MVFPIVGGTQDVAYDVSNSVRFRPAGQAQMSQGNGTQTNSKKWTISLWVKIAFDVTATAQKGLYSSTGSSSNGSFVQFSDSALKIGCQGVSETDWHRFIGNPAIQFRDPSAWYHLCFGFDSTQGTDSNRIKSYVNGVQVDYLDGEGNYPAQNDDSNFNNGSDCAIGKNITSNDSYFDGYISQFYFIDGTQYAASDFGRFNTRGVWVPKKFIGTFGNNGTFVEGDSNTADASGNGNNFGQSNTVVTQDSPTNNFCTLNSVAKDAHATLAEGNLKWTSGGNGGVVGTMAVANGKWYWESKGVDVGADSQLGIWQSSKDTGYPLDQYVGTGESWGYVTFSGKNIHSDSQSSAITVVNDNDIMMFALDMDNLKLWFGINGTWTQSGDPANGTNQNHSSITNEFMTPAIASFSGSSGYEWQFNFGNPAFTVSSGNADANGYGNFEYAPPSGFYALCTKNLAEYG